MSWQALIVYAGRAIWLSSPVLMTLGLILIAMTPAKFGGVAVPWPDFGLIAVFFWAIYGPAFFPPAAVFALGMTQDLLGAGPIGFWTTILLVTYGFALSQRVFFIGRTVLGVWVGFAVIALLSAVLAWWIAILYTTAWVDPWPNFQRSLITIVAFPIVGRLYMTLRRVLTTAPERP